MAAFISSTWQGTSTVIPNTGIKLTETDSVCVVRQTLAIASAQARYEATLYMRGELKELSESVKTELGGLVTGYICAAKSGAGR